jgi:ribosomal protein S18 acetylase RimI-like enzyme
MNDLNFIPINCNEIELKYSDIQFPLVFNYIGPNRSHGDLYYSLNWYEIMYNYNIIGLICLNDSKLIPKYFHISVFEIFEKNKGFGTKIMDYLFKFAKSLNYLGIILQANNNRAKIFYLRLGFIKKIIDNTPFLIKVL